jgi:hypothetical protein
MRNRHGNERKRHGRVGNWCEASVGSVSRGLIRGQVKESIKLLESFD